MDDQAVTPVFKDQRVGLIIFGALGILAGILCSIFCIFYVVMMAGVLGQVAKPPMASFVQVTTFYGGACLAFVWLGVGSILCRRWAPALIVAGGWLWLVSGAIGLAFLVAMHGAFDQTMAQAMKDTGGELRPGFLLIFKIVMFAFLALIYLIIPAALLAFYARRSVRMTCEVRDPVRRWTDGLPMPALIAATMFALGALCIIASIGNPAWPCFAILLDGPMAHVAVLLQGVLLAVVAWGAFRLKPWAWWLGLALPLLMMASFGVFMGTTGMESYLDALALSAQQRKAIQGSPFLEQQTWQWLMIAYPVVFVAFMVWVKPHFRGQVPSRDA